MLQAYRVSIEAAGIDARPAWADLVKQDQSIALSKTPQWTDCICSSDHFSDATSAVSRRRWTSIDPASAAEPRASGEYSPHLRAIGIWALMRAVSSAKEGHRRPERPVH